MRVVVYADDFEPITVIKLDQWAVSYLRETNRICLYTEPDCMPEVWVDDKAPVAMKLHHVVLHAVWFHRGRRYGVERDAGLILMADDHENALQLRSIFLPGQMRDVQEREQVAFSRGALHVIRKILGSDE